MLNWNYLETFVILSENLSFSQTARVLNTAQPVVSRQIKILEESLGYPLFIRSKKRVALSQQGVQLKHQLGPLVDEIKKILFQGEQPKSFYEGSVRMGSMFEAGQLILFPKIKKIIQAYPKLQLHLTLMSSKQINESILNGLLDFGFVYEVSNRKALKARAVCQDLPVLIADRKISKKWREASTYSLIGYREKDLYMENFLERNLARTELQKVQMRMSMNSHDEIIDLLRSEPDMMAVIPLSSAQKALEKDQIQILIRDKKPQDLFLICNEQILLDKRKKAFWEQLVMSFAQK